MEVRLDVKGRLNLLSILPVEGTLFEARVLWELRQALNFDGIEIGRLRLQSLQPGVVTWDPKVAQEMGLKSVPIPQCLVDRIKKILNDLDSKGKVREEHLQLFEIFCVL